MNVYQAYYTIVRFIPDLVRNEPINIGLIIHSPQKQYIRTEFADKKVNIISRYNEDIDPSVVKYVIRDIIEDFDNENYIIRNHKMGSFDDDKLLHKISAAHSNQLQFTRPKGVITQDLDKEFERLFEELVFKEERIKRDRAIEERTMKSTIRKKLNQFKLIEDSIVKENYIEVDRFGDKIKIDFKYMNGKPNLIKNISLDTKSKDPMEHSKLWLANYREIKISSKREGIDKNVQLIYCLPDDNSNINNSLIACLKEASDEMIDYRDEEKVNYFVNKIAKIAHN